jgi:hypothetical protein
MTSSSLSSGAVMPNINAWVNASLSFLIIVSPSLTTEIN